MNRLSLFVLLTMAMVCQAQDDLRLNDLEYFERQGVNVLVYSNSFNGGFNDEKNSGIEIIHHGVRTVQGGAVRLNNTPEQWDLVPTMTSRKVNRENGSIEVGLRYNDWPFLWGQNEGTIAGNTQYIIFGSSFKNIVGTNQ